MNLIAERFIGNETVYTKLQQFQVDGGFVLTMI